MSHISLFVSAVSLEFGSYRDVLRRELAGPQVDFKIQEDFIAAGGTTLRKLDDYIRHCHAVIHLVGDLPGADAHAQALADLRADHPDLVEKLPALAPCLTDGAPPLSYTQWEAWLALYHDKPLLIFTPADAAPCAAAGVADPAQRAAQQAHLDRLAAAGYYPQDRFTDATHLALRVRNSSIGPLLDAAAARPPARRLPWRSLGDRFTGRAAELAALAQALGPVPTRPLPVVARVVHGVGGVGKTRLAVEYAWRRAADYAAIFFLGGSDPGALASHLAALCAPDMLDLPEHQANEQAQAWQEAAVLRWLNAHPGWLLILDGLDTEEAAQAAEDRLPRLAGGHVLLTSRIAHWSSELTAPALTTLAPDAARDFLLHRTEDRRRPQTDDSASAAAIADELGHLALALEQAGAYIAERRQTLADYLADWRTDDAQRCAALAWFDARQMHYPKSIAKTWQNSFDCLGDTACDLLGRLAWLAPEAIPESLLDTPAAPATPDKTAAVTPRAALVELERYSLVDRARDATSFRLHRLVQTVSRDQQRDEARTTVPAALRAALAWVDEAFVGDTQDVRHWQHLEPLAPHAQVVAGFADKAGIAAPTARLLSQVGELLYAKARLDTAEPLLRRALEITEANPGGEPLNLADCLNDLAQLLKARSRLTEAEPLMRRALPIFFVGLGVEHPDTQRVRQHAVRLLQARGYREDEIAATLAKYSGRLATTRRAATDTAHAAV